MALANSPAEITIQRASEEAECVADTLLEMARQADRQAVGSAINISRCWAAHAGTYTYHTNVRVECADSLTFEQVVDCFFHAALLPAQPWYAQFLRGHSLPVTTARGSTRSVLCWPQFDFGLGKTHSYRQLLSEFSPALHCRVLVLRSVSHALDFPTDTTPAYTLSPTGDVLHWREGVLHWHHICTVTGVGILPAIIERHLINALRWLHLDQAERKTYLEEAESFMRWVRDADHVDATWRSIPALSKNNFACSKQR